MINWGVIGGGKIVSRFLKSLKNNPEGRLYAAASRTEAKREKLKSEYPDAKIYDNYDSLLADPQVDLVYIGLNHSQHFHWAKQALEAGKGVLCEKPATLTYEENKELADLAREKQVFFMEGLKTRFIPMIRVMKPMLEEGVIGDVTRVEGAFCSASRVPDDSWLFDAKEGGVLNDLSAYVLGGILDYMDSEITTIETQVEYAHGVDADIHAELGFADGRTAGMALSCIKARGRCGVIYGTKGKILMEPFHRPEKIRIVMNDGTGQELEKPYIHDDFYTEIAEAQRCFAEGLIESPYMTLEDSLRIRIATDQVRTHLKMEENKKNQSDNS